MEKKLSILVYLILIGVMAVTTFVEKYTDTRFVITHFYGSWWFSLIWALGTVCGAIYFLRARVKRISVILLHFSFLLILIGAMLTHFFSSQGEIDVRKGTASHSYFNSHNREQDLEFSLELDSFYVQYHAGTDAPMNYVAQLTITDQAAKEKVIISMNKIYTHGSVRLYLKNYLPDGAGCTLSLNSDPWGIPVTYLGYLLLAISLIWMLVGKGNTFRKMLACLSDKKVCLLMLLGMGALSVNAQRTVAKETAEQFGKLYIVYNDRVCLMETFAADFTKKLYGKSSYKAYSPTQVLMGFMFWGQDWMNEPILKVKQGEMRRRFKLKAHVAPSHFFNANGYILGPYLHPEENNQFSKDIMNVDDKLMLIMQVQQYYLLRMFPCITEGETIQWYAPNDESMERIPQEQRNYINNILPLLSTHIQQGNTKTVNEIVNKLQKYQQEFGASTLPSPLQVWAERMNNSIPFATILFMVNLTLAFISLFFLQRKRWYHSIAVLMGLSFVALTFLLSLRWMISGTIPMSNGYETTLILAWLIMLVAGIMYARVRVMLSFGLLASGLMLLVSHISYMDPMITHRMPVLNSPLLSIHVSIIMMAYALLTLTFLVSATYFIVVKFRKNMQNTASYLTALNFVFLYPGIAFLAIGIFVGAVWANISWGNYWSWDPKEVWALITLMIYAIPMHFKSFIQLKKTDKFHLFMLLSFLSVIMTYFGVNYFLGGMHSYA